MTSDNWTPSTGNPEDPNWSEVDDGVRQPSLPGTTTYTQCMTNDAWFDVTMSDPGVGATTLRIWAYAKGSGAQLSASLDGGSFTNAGAVLAAGYEWRYVDKSGTWSSGDLASMYSSIQSSATSVYVAETYIEIDPS